MRPSRTALTKAERQLWYRIRRDRELDGWLELCRLSPRLDHFPGGPAGRGDGFRFQPDADSAGDPEPASFPDSEVEHMEAD